MMSVSLRQLRYFDAVARHGHFGRAAEHCAVTQPALSMQIKDLEAALGGALFERNARGVHLTAFGAEVARRVQRILREVDDLAELSRGTTSGMIRDLRLGMIPTVAPYLLPQVMAALARAFPSLEVHVRETTTPKLVAELADGRLDVAVLALPVSEPTLVEVELFSEPFHLVRPACDADKPLPSPARLSEMRLLLLEEGHCFRDQALAFCNGDTPAMRDLLDASSLSTLVQMVSAGMGVTLIPDMAVAIETRSAAVDVRAFETGAIDGVQPTRTLGMVWRASSPLERYFREIAAAVSSAAGPPTME